MCFDSALHLAAVGDQNRASLSMTYLMLFLHSDHHDLISLS